jgi:hypothetical protein
MRRTDNGTPPASPQPAYRLPQDLPDLPTYERLIDYGIAHADGRGETVDHVTARRLAIWLAAHPQPPTFSRGLVRFVQTGAISQDLRTQLRIHARSGNYPDQPQAARLMEYTTARTPDFAPIGENFGQACDQIDRADVMLARLHEQAIHGHTPPELTWPDTDGPRIIALARRDPDSQTIGFILDPTTANIAMHAIAAYADERQAHIREVNRYAQTLPENSYGRHNRQIIAARETRITDRLRAVEHAYRTAVERDSAYRPPEPTKAGRSLRRPANREIELE